MWFHVETHHQKAPSAVVFNALHTDQNVEDRFLVSERRKLELYLHRQYGWLDHVKGRNKIR